MKLKAIGKIIPLATVLALCAAVSIGCGGGPKILADTYMVTMVINAPVEKVFSTMGDAQNSEKWLWVKVTKAEGQGLGAITEWTYEAEGESADYRTVVVEYVPNRKTVEKFIAIGGDLHGGGTVTVLYLPVDGKTRLTYIISYVGDLPGLTAPLSNTLRKKIRTDVEEGLKKFKAVAEG